jgi:hypothetical protein
MTERWRRSLRVLDTQEPSPDLWRRAVTRSSEAPLPEIPAPRQGRVVAGAVAALVAIAGVTIAFLAFRGLGTEPAAGELVTYRDPSGAWELDYPDRFRLGRLPLPNHPRVITEGIWIANWDAPTFNPETGGPILSEFPDDGVVVFASQTFGGPVRFPTKPDSSFPITLEDLQVEATSTSGLWRMGAVQANGDSYLIQVRVRPDASERDQKAAADIVSSFRILPLEEGTVIGRHPTFYVLGPPGEYPVGTVTRFNASTLPRSETAEPFPFFLVRVPEGFYALAWPGDLVGGYPECDVTYDSAAGEFSCPNGARWALDGSVIAMPDPDLRDVSLRVLLVRISLDGHVLVSPDASTSDTELDLKVT